MKELWIKTNDFESAETLHSYIGKFLDFPDYYGGNLAALHDCLTDLMETTGITYQDTGYQNQDMAFYFQKVLRVLVDAAEENPAIRLIID